MVKENENMKEKILNSVHEGMATIDKEGKTTIARGIIEQIRSE